MQKYDLTDEWVKMGVKSFRRDKMPRRKLQRKVKRIKTMTYRQAGCKFRSTIYSNGTGYTELIGIGFPGKFWSNIHIDQMICKLMAFAYIHGHYNRFLRPDDTARPK